MIEAPSEISTDQLETLSINVIPED
jgi:hypothetical protein